MKERLSDLMLPAPVNGGFSMEDYWIWGGSVVYAEDGNYHMFVSRWSKELPFHPGWLVGSEIVRAVSKTPEGPYQFEEIVLPSRGAQYWDGRTTFNPQIIKFDDTYVLYYTGSTHPFTEVKNGIIANEVVTVARANKRIGIATSNCVAGPWKRNDFPLLNTRPDKFDSFLTSNPAPCVAADGKVIMLYKSRSYIKDSSAKQLHGAMNLGVAIFDSFNGNIIFRKDSELIPEIELEDPFVWIDKDGYNMTAKDMTGIICGQKQGGIYARSQDGIEWNIKKNFLFYSRDIRWSDGTVKTMGNLERPFILFVNGNPTHVSFATSDGNGEGFCGVTQTWNVVIPLKH